MTRVRIALLAFAALLLGQLAAQAQVTYSTWSIFHQPVAATQATISRAATAGFRHVAVSATVCISPVAVQADIIFNLRDGATGAGTVLYTWRLASAAGTSKCETAYLQAMGTANTAMTLESAAAPAATNFASVSLNGYDVNG